MAPADKKPVGFATHIIAGGIAGMSEAVRRPITLNFVHSHFLWFFFVNS
jgi:hypothetical protein